jgi:CheY-like chemotaxis protein
MTLETTTVQQHDTRTRAPARTVRKSAIFSAAPKVLVVDEDPCFRELLSLHLSNAGYDVVAAEDAVAAGHALLDSIPQLMVVDVDIPYMNGFELMAAMKADPKFSSIPVVFLTTRDDARERARRFGAVACLKKPMYANELVSAVSGIVPTGVIALG